MMEYKFLTYVAPNLVELKTNQLAAERWRVHTIILRSDNGHAYILFQRERGAARDTMAEVMSVARTDNAFES